MWDMAKGAFSLRLSAVQLLDDLRYDVRVEVGPRLGKLLRSEERRVGKEC